MTKPILYSAGETAFTDNGLGILPDAARCIVTEERNGMFELELDYPISGLHYADIKLRSLILAKPNPVDDPQPFRVYRITRPMGGMVTVYAQHISYDLAGITVSPFAANSAAAALTALKTYAAESCPFSFWTDKQTAATMTVKAPESIRALLGGQQGSVLDCYGGEYKFDRYLVRLYGSRGADRGVTIRYGKNLTTLEQDENCAAVYTGVHPFWLDSNGDQLVTLPEKVLAAPGTYNFTRIKPLDLSGEWQEAPTVSQLRARAQRYIQENNIGVPSVSLDISFVPLEQTQEYADKALLERVELCDTVSVEFPALGVSATAKVAKTIYDSLQERYKGVSIGDARASIADTIIQQGQEIKRSATETKTALQQAVDNATSLITGNSGGYVVLHSSSGQKEPDEILIMDKPKIADAVKIWRWNKQGLGYSSHGYNGPYGLAMTADGAIVADFITTGSLNAALVKIGEATLTSVLNGIQTRVGTTEGNISKLTQTIDGFTLSATNNQAGTSSTLKLTSGGTEITSTDIKFNGLVSFNDLSSTDPNNKTTINGSLITAGKIQSTNGNAYFDLDAGILSASQLQTLLDYSNGGKGKVIVDMRTSIDGHDEIAGLGFSAFYPDGRLGGQGYIGMHHYIPSDWIYGQLEISADHSLKLTTSEQKYHSMNIKIEEDEISFSAMQNDIANHTTWNHTFFIARMGNNLRPGNMVDEVEIDADLYAEEFITTSDRNLKEEIVSYSTPILLQICCTAVYQYTMKSDSQSSSKAQAKSSAKKITPKARKHLGLMYDEAPKEIRSESGEGKKGIDLYAMCSMLWKGVQELTERLERLEAAANG